MTEEKVIDSAELAAILGTDRRTARRFLRKHFPDLVSHPGLWQVKIELVPELYRRYYEVRVPVEPIDADKLVVEPHLA